MVVLATEHQAPFLEMNFELEGGLVAVGNVRFEYEK